MNKEYLTIKEYAEIRGVSLTAVYKRLNTSLNPYVTVKNGKKVLFSKVLEDEGLKTNVENVIKQNSTISTLNSTSSSTSFFEEQIKEKDKLNFIKIKKLCASKDAIK